jgi:toxin ParE1/3/4
MKPIRIKTEAEGELWDSVDFYEKRNPGLGLDFEQEVRRVALLIQNTPNRFPLQKDGTRKVVMKRFPFAIYYVEMTDSIWVIAVAHTRRKPWYWRERL